MPYELFLTRQTTKLGNAFASNMSKDVKLSKTHLSKRIQSGWFLGKTLGNITINLGKDTLSQHSLAKAVLPKLAIKATSSMLDKFQRKKSDKEP